MSAAHAFLAPSSAARWVVCPGSASMEAQFPDPGDRAAAEAGEKAHWVFAQMLEGWAPEVLMAEDKAVTQEMIEGAQMLLDDVRATLESHGLTLSSRADLMVEKHTHARRIHPECWGTLDLRLWVYLGEGRSVLYIWDYKYGHKHVEVFENKQLVCYAAGELDDATDEAQCTLVLRIVQPRSYHRDGPIREWRLRAADLEPYAFALSMAAEEATSPGAECKPQADACENCKARHACPALQRAAFRGMDLAHQAQADVMAPAAMGLELRYLMEAQSLMNARITGLQQQVESTLRQGQSVPHWTLRPGASRLGWTAPIAEVVAAGDMLGVDLRKPADAITPTQAKKAGFPPALIGAYAAAPSGAMKLELDDGTSARRIFNRNS